MYKIYANGTLFCSSKIEDLVIYDPVIDLEVNKAGTFKFVIPPNHPNYNLIQRKITLIDVYRDDEAEPLFEGVCTSTEVDFYKQKHIFCEGELTFLNDSTLRPSYKQGLTSRQLLEAYINEHNSLVESMKRFTVGQVTARDTNDSITCYTNYNSTMTEIKEDLVDDIGGFFRCRHENGIRYLDYLADSPRTNNQVIELGQNLLDLTQSLDTADLATVIIPLGATLETQSIQGLDERLTIKTASADTYHPSGKDYVYSSQAVTNFGWIEKVVTWDDVTTVSALLSKGEKYLQETQWENLIITARAIDLGLTSSQFNKFKLLDSIRVVSEPHGLDRYFMLSKMSIHLNSPENDTVTLGIEEPKTLSAKTSSENQAILREIEQMPTSNAVKAAIDNATALITGAEGGYVVIERNAQGQPTEIKIQNALSNPTKIWRWNQNGFGYSNDGGQTYGLAMTMDGTIVADYITSGTMTANRVRGGEFLVGGSGLSANGSITVKDSNNNTIATLDTSGMDVKKGSIKGSYIKLGGSESGWIDVRNSSDVRVAQFSETGLIFVNPTTGQNASQITPNNLIINDENGSVWTQINNQSLTLFNGRTSGNNTFFHVDRTADSITLNTENLYLGTNSGRTYRAPNNLGPFILPTALSSDGKVTAALQGIVFLNGIIASGL